MSRMLGTEDCAQVLGLEHSFFADGSPDLYERIVGDDAVFLIPTMGRLTKRQCVEAARYAGAWTHHVFDDVEVDEIAPGVLAVSYHVIAQRDDDDPYEAWLGSVWRRVDADWQLVFNQHSPIDREA